MILQQERADTEIFFKVKYAHGNANVICFITHLQVSFKDVGFGNLFPLITILVNIQELIFHLIYTSLLIVSNP